jgi:hypothetical protein
VTTDCKARTQMKAMWLLCMHCQEKLPYSLAGVDSNDVLFPTPAEKSTSLKNSMQSPTRCGTCSG